MTDLNSEFNRLLGDVRKGNRLAIVELVTRFGPHVLRIVRRRLNYRLRSKFDSTDFVQSVWASFFRNAEELREFAQPADLILFLQAIARNKITDQTRRCLMTSKRDVRREQSLDEPGSWSSVEMSDARQPLPSEIAVAREHWNQLLDRQPLLHRRVVEMRFQGATFNEIAAKLEIHERTARKIARRVIAQWWEV